MYRRATSLAISKTSGTTSPVSRAGMRPLAWLHEFREHRDGYESWSPLAWRHWRWPLVPTSFYDVIPRQVPHFNRFPSATDP